MNNEGLEQIREAVEGVGGILDLIALGDDEDLAFIDINTATPATVLNSLHEADLLAVYGEPKAPSLRLVQSVATGSQVTMTFIDLAANDWHSPEYSVNLSH